MSTDSTIDALRTALEHSPDNVPLRLHVAQVLMDAERHSEAMDEFTRVLNLEPDNRTGKLGVCKASRMTGKADVALVLMEDLLGDTPQDPDLQLEYARILLLAGQVADASNAYRMATAAKPELADPSLTERLGVDGEVTRAKPAPSSDDSRRVRYAESEADDFEFVFGNASDDDSDDSSDDVIAELENPGLTFADVGGMEDVKEEIRMKIILPMTNKSLYEAYGKKVGGGILLYGPPGCGKTHLARATAGEVNAGFIAVGLNDVLVMWIGQRA